MAWRFRPTARGEPPPLRLVDLPDNPLPPGAVLSGVPVDGLVLRVAHWLPADTEACRGTVVVLPGRSEFIEKYAEVVGDLLARRFAVVVVDWRGQGGSGRLLADRRRGHVRSFADYRTDLAACTGQILRPFCPSPWYALAHSMGGAIALDAAAHGDAPFARIVLSAPMLDIWGLRAPRAARATAAWATRLGRGRGFIPGGSGRSWMSQPFAGNVLTSDPGRYAAFQALAAAAPHLLIGAPTLGWLHAAFGIMDELARSDALQRITIPVLAVACGGDRVVESAATERVVARIKGGRTITVPHALHEVLMERDVYREQFWAAFDSFVPGQGPEPDHAATRNRNAPPGFESLGERAEQP